jgi:hypothetical protein
MEARPNGAGSSSTSSRNREFFTRNAWISNFEQAQDYQSHFKFEPSVAAAIIAGKPITTAATAKAKASIMAFPL